jgi:hypothetical protein
MKANRPLSPEPLFTKQGRYFLRRHRWLQGALGLGVMAMLSSCVGPPQAAPAPPPRAVAPPPVHVAPAPVPHAARMDWRDAPITPGDWHWAREGADSVARYTAPRGSLFVLRCTASARMVTIDLPAPATMQTAGMSVTTSSQTRALTLQARGSWLETALGARDTLLDAMAFSRGRFMVEVQGGETLYLPSWPEVSRVVEDCRAS